VPSPRADGNVCLVTRPNGRRWVERAGRKDDRYGKGTEVQMNPASTPRCPYRPLPRVKEEERARAPVFHRRVRENTPRVDGTRHEAHGNVHHVSRPTGRRGGRASEERTRHAEATTVRSYNRRYPHRDEKKRPYAPERPETTKSRGMNDSPWPMPRVAKMRHAVVGRVHKTPPNHLPDISLSTPNPHAGVGGQRDGPSLGLPPNSTQRRIITTRQPVRMRLKRTGRLGQR